MNKLFLILLPSQADRDVVIKHLSETGVITYYFYNTPYTFYVRSNFDSQKIYTAIIQKFDFDRLVVLNINSATDIYGLVPNDHAPLYNPR